MKFQTMIERRGFVATALAAIASLTAGSRAKADGIQVVGNHGQIVSTGDVNLRAAAGGVQVMDGNGNWTAVQGVSNDIQVVSTGNVNADLAASGQQTVYNARQGSGYDGETCNPGEYYEEDGCAFFCGEDGCTWYSHCCPSCPKPKGKCCK